MESPTLRAVDLSRLYGRVVALAEVTLDLGEGVTALVGVNGAGKSTLLTTLAGGLPPTSGRVEVGGNDLYARQTRRRGLSHVALVPQLPSFPANLTAREVVAYLAWMRGVSGGHSTARASDALGRVGLGDKASAKVGSLSGGMLRRLALAQALAADADVLLLDEPSTGLDPQQRRTMVDVLRELSGTVLVSSHVMEDVADLAERVIVLDKGHIRFDGGVESLRSRAPEGVAEHRRLEAGFLSVCLGSGIDDPGDRAVDAPLFCRHRLSGDGGVGRGGCVVAFGMAVRVGLGVQLGREHHGPARPRRCRPGGTRPCGPPSSDVDVR